MEGTTTHPGSGVAGGDQNREAVIDRLYDELVELSEKWKKMGDKCPTSTWITVPQAIIAAIKMKLAPELEEFAVMEASLRMVKKIAGDDAAAVDRASDQIPILYHAFRPACVLVAENYFSVDAEDGHRSSPENSKISEERHGCDGPKKSSDIKTYGMETAIIEPDVVPQLNYYIELVDSLVKLSKSKSPSDNGKTESESPGGDSKHKCPSGDKEHESLSGGDDEQKFPEGEAKHQFSTDGESKWAKMLESISSAIASAFSFAAKQVRKVYPKLGKILSKIGKILTDAGSDVVPMAKNLPPERAWTVGIVGMVIVAIGVALSVAGALFPDS